jgi:hypothetical protein
LTVCNDGNIRNLVLLKILSIGSKKSIPVDGAQEQHDDGGPASSDIPDIVDFQAAVGSGVEVCACATFVSKSSLALALSNKMCKFLNIPDLKDENSSGSQQFVLGWSDVSAIDFIPPASSRKLYTVAFVCNHPRPNSVSCVSVSSFILRCDTVNSFPSSVLWDTLSAARVECAAATSCTRRSCARSASHLVVVC